MLKLLSMLRKMQYSFLINSSSLGENTINKFISSFCVVTAILMCDI